MEKIAILSFKNCQIAVRSCECVYYKGHKDDLKKYRIFSNQKSGVVIGKQANPLFIECEIFITCSKWCLFLMAD